VRLAALAAALLAAGPASACRLALVLALDISSSVDRTEDALQRAGLASALLAPEVAEALLALPEAPVALAVFEWSGRYQQDVLLDWVLIDSASALQRAAATIRSSQRSYAEFPTALGYALGYAASVFRDGPDCLTRTLDVSGDGINNDGFSPALAYRHFPLAEITVNALVIGGATEDDLAVLDFYEREVIRGPGAFVMVADDFTDFERAMRQKLLREVAARVVGDAGGLRRAGGG